MKYGTISFSELRQSAEEHMKREQFPFKDDCNSCVMMGVLFDTNAPEDEVQRMEEKIIEYFRKDVGFVTKDVKVEALLRITGNVKGEDGSHDWVIVFSGDPAFNVINRPMSWVKWICDYTVNYADWYE